MSRIRQERLLLIPIVAAILALVLEHSVLEAGQIPSLMGAAALIAAIVVARCALLTMPRSLLTRSAIPMAP